MTDFREIPYAEWLEEGLKLLLQEQPEKLGLVATMSDGTTMTGYYNADATDKAVFAHNIYTDAILDTVLCNIADIKEALNELEQSSDSDDDEDSEDETWD